MRLACCVVRCCLLHSRCTRTSPGTAAHSGPGRRPSAISCTEITTKINKLETADLHSCARVWRHFSLTDSLLGAEKKDGLHTSTSKHSWRPKQTHCSVRTIWSKLLLNHTVNTSLLTSNFKTSLLCFLHKLKKIRAETKTGGCHTYCRFTYRIWTGSDSFLQ